MICHIHPVCALNCYKRMLGNFEFQTHNLLEGEEQRSPNAHSIHKMNLIPLILKSYWTEHVIHSLHEERVQDHCGMLEQNNHCQMKEGRILCEEKMMENVLSTMRMENILLEA